MMHGRTNADKDTWHRDGATLSLRTPEGAAQEALNICPSCGCQLRQFGRSNFGNVVIDEFGSILFEGVAMNLPRSQHVIVEVLVRAKGRGLTRGLLANALDDDLEESVIPKYIERTRRSFEQIEPAFDQISVLRGFGAYRWVFKSPRQALGRS